MNKGEREILFFSTENMLEWGGMREER